MPRNPNIPFPGAGETAKNFRMPTSINTGAEKTKHQPRVGGQIVDFGAAMPPKDDWRKAKKSIGNYACVELGTNEQLRLIRDSKNPNGGIISVSPKALGKLLKSIKKGKFNN